MPIHFDTSVGCVQRQYRYGSCQQKKGGGKPKKIELATIGPASDQSSIHFAFTVREPGFVRLRLYDVMGREVATLLEEWKTEGRHVYFWNASGIPTGTYFARLSCEGDGAVTKVHVIR